MFQLIWFDRFGLDPKVQIRFSRFGLLNWAQYLIRLYQLSQLKTNFVFSELNFPTGTELGKMTNRYTTLIFELSLQRD